MEDGNPVLKAFPSGHPITQEDNKAHPRISEERGTDISTLGQLWGPWLIACKLGQRVKFFVYFSSKQPAKVIRKICYLEINEENRRQ